MALSLEALNAVRQRCVAEAKKVKTQAQIKALFSYLAQHKGSPQLQFVAFDSLSANQALVADPCKLYAVYTKKPSGSTTTSFFKLTDNATTGSATAEDFKFPMQSANEDLVLFFDGLSLAAGASVLGQTTSDGSTASNAADRATGWLIVGAP